MTRVDFYLLSTAEETARLRVVCRLADKVFGLGQQLYIHTADAEQTRHLDRLLWTFQDISFLPHSSADDETAMAPIRLGHDQTPAAGGDVLINLAPETPHFFSRFERVAEIVDEQPEVRAAGRTRYRFYRDRGYPLQHHQLGS
ncbi:DNA polymerase III subunit chi [Acidihalobacter prosperus]